MKWFPLLLAFIVSAPAHALDAACEVFVNSAEKSAAQPNRHTLSVLKDGTQAQTIVVGSDSYIMTGGQWRKMPTDLRAAERKVIADVRSGKIKVEKCQKLGNKTVEGVATSVLAYTVTMPGTAPVRVKIYTGKDGLTYAQTSKQVEVHYRYSGVTAPKL